MGFRRTRKFRNEIRELRVELFNSRDAMKELKSEYDCAIKKLSEMKTSIEKAIISEAEDEQ